MRIVPYVLTLPFLLTAFSAHAEEPSGSPKGIIGGALLGGEVVIAAEAAFKVRSPWAYLGGGLAGAAAGGLAGHFIEDGASPRVPLVMLAAGLTLAVPTTVAVLSATAYEPPADFVQDQGPTDEPVAEPPRPGSPTPGATPSPATGTPDAASEVPATTPPATTPTEPPRSERTRRTRAREATATRYMPPALVDIQPEKLSLSVPSVEVGQVFSRREIAMGAPKATEVRIPLLNVLF
ncbi:MAG TPA: hypothetical protein VFQ61_25190 [Polyangiaceae bacterium]|nr:hypothetical protein [Polyangiaceae bacterium]